MNKIKLEDFIRLGTITLADLGGQVDLIFEPDLSKVAAKKTYTVLITRPDLAGALAVLAGYMADTERDAFDNPATFFDPDDILGEE